MVGDRKHDVVAARRNAVSTLGVTYGYGSEEELLEAGVERLCRQPPEIVSHLRKIESTSAQAI